jgi:nucleotide-binding universal stress UspA family protein
MTRVLVPVEVLEGESVSQGLISLLSPMDVTVLGYHVLPEQTPADQARLQYEDQATDALEDLEDAFRSAGGDADHRLVFTHDEEQTIDRVAAEVDARAIVLPGMTVAVDELLVSLSGDVAVERILAFVTDLVGDRDVDVTLFHAGKDASGAAERLESSAVDLRGHGISVRTETTVDSPLAALLGVVPAHDAVVMGEKAPSFRSLVFGDETDRVASASVGPVLVVRYDESLDGQLADRHDEQLEAEHDEQLEAEHDESVDERS